MLIVSIKIFLAFFPALFENAERATRPMALALEAISERERRIEKIERERRYDDTE